MLEQSYYMTNKIVDRKRSSNHQYFHADWTINRTVISLLFFFNKDWTFKGTANCDNRTKLELGPNTSGRKTKILHITQSKWLNNSFRWLRKPISKCPEAENAAYKSSSNTVQSIFVLNAVQIFSWTQSGCYAQFKKFKQRIKWKHPSQTSCTFFPFFVDNYKQTTKRNEKSN